MDIAKLKEFAITAAGKAKDGAIKANELRKKSLTREQNNPTPCPKFRTRSTNGYTKNHRWKILYRFLF